MFPDVDPDPNLLGLERNAEIRWKRARGGCRANPVAFRIIGPDFRRRRRNRLLALGFERLVQCGQVLREKLIELLRRIIKFVSKSVDISGLVRGGFAFVAQDRSVKLVGVLTQPFLAGDRAAFGRGHNFLSHPVHFSVEIGDLLAERIAFWQ